jgi:hypothetical protein
VFGDELAVDQRQAALAPFAALAEIPEAARPQENGSGGCAQPARTIHSVPPPYPPMAGVSGTAGLVDDDDRPGVSDLVNAAILSAAASTYALEIRDCKGVKCTYVFAVIFNRR